MTPTEKKAREIYIGAYIDGYFSDKKLDFGIKYYSLLEIAISDAEKKWSLHNSFPNRNIINEWLDKNGCPEIKKQVEQEALELFKENIIEDVFEWLTTQNYLTDLKKTLIENYNSFKNK